MKTGQLRHYLFVQTAARADDGRGGKLTTWSDAWPAWAEIEPLSGREHFFAHQIAPGVTHRVRMRAREDKTLRARDRLRFGSRIFEVVSVIDADERDRELVIQAQELAG